MSIVWSRDALEQRRRRRWKKKSIQDQWPAARIGNNKTSQHKREHMYEKYTRIIMKCIGWSTAHGRMYSAQHHSRKLWSDRRIYSRVNVLSYTSEYRQNHATQKNGNNNSTGETRRRRRQQLASAAPTTITLAHTMIPKRINVDGHTKRYCHWTSQVRGGWWSSDAMIITKPNRTKKKKQEDS